MAFDQTSIPNNLRPLNTVRNVPEEPRISPVTSSGRPVEGFYAHPRPDVGGSPNSVPAVYYPATVADAGFAPLGYNNAVTGVSGWVQHIVPPPPPAGAVMNPASGFTNTSPSFGTRFGGSASDQASEESGDASFSGQKVKFMCSFGGKILPRVSDGALRYVGGHTRIISVRKDVSFVEFVQKMSDMYGENVVIKYQLPDEDLDALVSVSCPDDLENMMDEYEKLIERSSDGSAKLRIFLFSPSELENAGLAHIGDLQDVGHKYVEAVNGITDGLSGGGGGGRIARNESIESANSALNSDMSGTEGADSLAPSLGEVSGGGLSPKGNYTVPFDTTPRMVCVDPNTVPYADPSATPLLVKSGPTTAFGVVSEQEIERNVPLAMPQALPSAGFQASSPYIPAYVDHHQETLNHANYVQLPSPMGFPGQILGPMGPVFTQQHIPVSAPPQQFTPNHMNPSFISMNQNPVRAVIQPQHVRVEHYPGESVVAQQRVVQLPVEQGYSNAHQAQIPTMVQGGVYNWHQIRHPEQVVFPEGGVSSPPVMFSDRSSPRLEDCHMCQKQLPHAHSDTVAQEQKDIPAGAVSDLRSIYCSLPVDGRGRPVISPLAAGTTTEGCTEQLAGGVSRNDEGQYGNDKTIPLRAANPEHSGLTPPPQVVITSGVQVPYGVFVVNSPPSPQDNVVVQPQIQVMQDTTFNRPLNHDFVPVGVTLQAKDYVIRDSPSPVNVAGGIPVDDSKLTFDNLRQIDGRLQNIQISPSELLSSNEHSKYVADPRKEDALENRPHQIGNSVVTESPICNPSLVYSGVEPAHAAQRNPPFSEWKDNVVWSQPKISSDIEGVAHDGSSISPSYRMGGNPEDSASLFVNQDPWNMRPDTHFPPPRPSKIQLRKENPGSCRDSLLETQLSEGAHQPSGHLIQDFSSDRSLSNKGSAEEQIRQELQAVAEGVAASVLCSSGPSTPPISQQSGDFRPVNVDIQQRDEFEEISTRLSERINFGYPASGIGRLQIIKNIDLEELRELGSGTFGTVYHGKWRGTDVAIKRINDRCFAGKPSEQDRMRDDFWNEAIKLADLHHPNVVAFYGIVLDGPDGSIATVTEYMVNGSLRNALQKNERNLDKRKRLLIGMDVAFGMEYLHGKNIVHFDLKSDNLLVNLRDPHRPICKVGDLGLSKVKCNTLISGGVRGTLPWMAPELLNGSSSLVSEKVDVFSFGIVMWELVTGDEPYADLHYGAIIGGIVSNTLRPPVPEACDPEWTALMERCWSSEPRERPDFTEIASELRSMAAKLPPKGQAQSPSGNPQVKG